MYMYAHAHTVCAKKTFHTVVMKYRLNGSVVTNNTTVVQRSSLETRPSPSSAIIITLTFEPYRSYGGRRPGRIARVRLYCEWLSRIICTRSIVYNIGVVFARPWLGGTLPYTHIHKLR